jgi:hypothetical protein
VSRSTRLGIESDKDARRATTCWRRPPQDPCCEPVSDCQRYERARITRSQCFEVERHGACQASVEEGGQRQAARLQRHEAVDALESDGGRLLLRLTDVTDLGSCGEPALASASGRHLRAQHADVQIAERAEGEGRCWPSVWHAWRSMQYAPCMRKPRKTVYPVVACDMYADMPEDSAASWSRIPGWRTNGLPGTQPAAPADRVLMRS